MARKRQKPPLTAEILLESAAAFGRTESEYPEPSLYGVTDGKAVGTYLEQKFRAAMMDRYAFAPGNSAVGIDFPELGVDLKVTSIRQPQSSCPFRDARQKVFGLGYSLLVFVYEKADDPQTQTAILNIRHIVFVPREFTADYQTTRGLREILERDGNRDDLTAFLLERNLPGDEIVLGQIAEEVLRGPPELGYLTISNALQWRLQYGRVIEHAGRIAEIRRVL